MINYVWIWLKRPLKFASTFISMEKKWLLRMLPHPYLFLDFIKLTPSDSDNSSAWLCCSCYYCLIIQTCWLWARSVVYTHYRLRAHSQLYRQAPSYQIYGLDSSMLLKHLELLSRCFRHHTLTRLWTNRFDSPLVQSGLKYTFIIFKNVNYLKTT